MVKNTEKIVNSSKKVTNSSQTTSSSRTTTTSDSKSSTSSNSSSHQNKKEQKPKAQNRSLSQRQSKAEKDPVQVHNRYGRLDVEEESVWNVPPDDSPSPMDESPSETRKFRVDLQREDGGRALNGRKAFPRSDTHNGFDHPMKLSRSKG